MKKQREVENAAGKPSKWTFIFRGLKANTNAEWPPMSKALRPWHECVSEDWLCQTNNAGLPFRDDGATIPVLNLDLTDDMFDAEDLAWLADDEGEVSIEDKMGAM